MKTGRWVRDQAPKATWCRNPPVRNVQRGKCVETERRLLVTRSWGSGEQPFNGHRLSLWGQGNVLELMVVTVALKPTELYTYMVNYTVPGLNLNKAAGNKAHCQLLSNFSLRTEVVMLSVPET